ASDLAPGREELAIARVGQELRGLLDGDPADGIDLVAGLSHAPVGIHHPVADDLQAALVITVGGGGELLPQHAPERRLLLDLAERARLVGLSRLQLPLGERPVLAVRPVDQEYLALAALGPP